MPLPITADICIIGAGSGGLSLAAGTAQLGLKTVLIERAEMGGDCLNTGCVPSKALLAAAARAQTHRKSDIKGIKAQEPDIDFAAVKDYVSDVIGAIAPHDSQQRFESMGVHVIREHARFIDNKTVQAGPHTIKARYFVIATGSRPSIPRIKGAEENKILTNETIFSLREKPHHLLIIGGGPIGLEMAQAHRRLGCDVSIFDRGEILPRDDKDHAAIIREKLTDEGISFYENTAIHSLRHTDNGVTLTLETAGKTKKITGSHILIAAGRAPNTDGLDLDKADIAYTAKGISVDAHLRSTNKRVYAIGDVAGGPQFTHIAGYHAGIIIRQICFKIFWAKVDYKALPWVTYTDPEIAQVGESEATAKEKYGDAIKTVEWSFAENDRAVAQNTTTGQIKVIATKKGHILGVSIVGHSAGELIGLWALAITKNMKIGDITAMIAPYPTLGEISKRAAGAWFTPRLFSDKTKRIVELLQKLPF